MSIREAEKRLSEGEVEKALAIANQVLYIDPSNSFCRQFRAWVYQCIGGSSISLALVDYKRCLEDRPHSASVLIDRAIAYIHQCHYHLAVHDLTQAIHTSTNRLTSFIYWLRSFAYRLDGRLEAAVTDLNQAISNDDSDQIPYLISRADLLRHLGRDKEAITDIDMVLCNNPDSVDANQIRSHLRRPISLQSSMIPRATPAGLEAIRRYHLNQYEDVITIGSEHDNDASVLMIVALTYLQLHHPHEALQTSNRALILDPSRPLLFYIRGQAFQRLNRISQALANFREAIRIHPQFDSAIKSASAIESQLESAIKNQGSSNSEQHLQLWSCDQVIAWLRRNHINSDIVKRFEEFAIDGRTLWRSGHEDLEFIGIRSQAIRQNILEAIAIEKTRIQGKPITPKIKH